MVGDIFEQILPLLNVKKDYKNQIDKELRWFIDTPYYNVPNFINLNKSKIKPSPYYKYLYIGNGSTVIDQEPSYGERITEGGTIILYLNWFKFCLRSGLHNILDLVYEVVYNICVKELFLNEELWRNFIKGFNGKSFFY